MEVSHAELEMFQVRVHIRFGYASEPVPELQGKVRVSGQHVLHAGLRGRGDRYPHRKAQTLIGPEPGIASSSGASRPEGIAT